MDDKALWIQKQAQYVTADTIGSAQHNDQLIERTGISLVLRLRQANTAT